MRQKSLLAIFSNCALYINRGCCFSLDILDLVVSKRLSLVIRDPKMIPTLTVALFLSLFWPQIQSFPQGRFGLPYSDGENANSASRLFTVKRNKILFPRVGDEETNMAFRDEVQGRFGPRYRDGESNAGKRFEAVEEDYGNENIFLERAGHDENLGGYVKNSDEMEKIRRNRVCRPDEELCYLMTCCPK